MSDNYAIDGHKLAYHPQRVAQLLDAGDDWEKSKNIYPIYIEVSPVGACNHRCTFCGVDYIGYKSISLDYENFKERLKEMGSLGVKSIMYAGEGEPLMHKKINDIVRATYDAGIDISFTTNGTQMDKAFVESSLSMTQWIKLSVNAGTPKTYSDIHQTKEQDFNKVIENISYATRYKNENGINCTIGVQTLLLPENADEIEELARLCRDELGVDYLVVKAYSQVAMSNNKKYESIDYSLYENLGSRLAVWNTDKFKIVYRGHSIDKYQSDDSRGYTTCYSTPFLLAYIMADGDVYGCRDHLLNPRFEYGNVGELSFQEIWEGEKRRKSVNFVLNELDLKDCRKNCRMDEANRFLFKLKEDPVSHVNFI
jgi:GTP 3',8-cyclase